MLITHTHLVVEYTVGRRDKTVYLKLVKADESAKEYGLSWEQADELARGIRRPAWDEGPRYTGIHFKDGAYLVPRQLAHGLWCALVAKAREVEEQVKAASIAWDQALLMRTSAPLGFSSDPKIQDEAAKLAAHDPTLRKAIAMPASIKSKEAFGMPTVLNHRRPLDERVVGASPARLARVRAALGKVQS